MTQPLTPTQADRDAAASAVWGEIGNEASDDFRDEVRTDKRDATPFVQAFALHAQAARLEGALAMREAAAKECDRVAFEDRVNVSKGRKPITGNLAGGYCANAIRDLDPLSIAEKDGSDGR